MHPDFLRGNIKPLDKTSIGMWAPGSMRRDLRVNKRAVFANRRLLSDMACRRKVEDDIRRSGISIIKYRLTYIPVGLKGCVLEAQRIERWF